jgi:LmbE family N-acetylglucosaminyl deacetylase
MLDTVAVPRPRQAPESKPEGAPAPCPGKLSVLAMIARPGQESVELGALLYAFSHAGASVALLTLSRGEASPVNSSSEPLETIRPRELQVAAWVLGVTSVAVADYPDRRLAAIPPGTLAERAVRAIRTYEADLLAVLDPAGSGSEDAAVAAAAVSAGLQAGLPVVACTGRGAAGSWQLDLGADAADARAAQRSATAAHVSQSRTQPATLQRLDGLDGREYLRWLSPAATAPLRASSLLRAPASAAEALDL